MCGTSESFVNSCQLDLVGLQAGGALMRSVSVNRATLTEACSLAIDLREGFPTRKRTAVARSELFGAKLRRSPQRDDG